MIHYFFCFLGINNVKPSDDWRHETQCYGYLLFLITSYIVHCSINYDIEHSN